MLFFIESIIGAMCTLLIVYYASYNHNPVHTANLCIFILLKTKDIVIKKMFFGI